MLPGSRVIRGKRIQAQNFLTPICGRFTEEPDTTDTDGAKALFDRLAGAGEVVVDHQGRSRKGVTGFRKRSCSIRPF
jgi:hypothetical protein